MVDSTVFWACTIAYLGVTLGLSYLAYKKTRVGEDFLLAGRNVPSWVIGLSYGSTFISTSAIVGFGGVAAAYGMGIIWLTVLCIGVGVLVAFLLYGKRVRKIGKSLRAMTFPDLLGKRFNSPFLQYSTSLLILLMMPLYASAVLIGGSQFLRTTLDIDYNAALLGFAVITAVYVVFGGLLAVMYTDSFQGAVMLFGMTAILVLTFVYLGGWEAANTSLAGLATDPGVPAGLRAQGMNGWTEFPDAFSSNWLVLVTTVIMGVGIGVLAQPQLTVRFMTAKDGKILNRAVPVGALFIGLSTGVAFTIGALSNVWFYSKTENPKYFGKLATQVAIDKNIDTIIPLYINDAMPDLIVVIFMLTLLAAAMSTLSALFHTMGSSAGHDLWCHLAPSRLMPKKYRQDITACSLRANRYGTAMMIFFSVLLAFYMPGSIIMRATAMFMGLCAAAFLPMFTYGIFSKEPRAMPAKISLVVGAVTWFTWTAFVHIKESEPLGISNLLFGRPAVLDMPWQVVDPLVIALPASVIALIAAVAVDRWARMR
ncbi:MAG: sodium:solute symporter family protein [Methanomassiliicoccales archaeon]|nr:MAG: sodium:solute symporter family protein [Methanomassiliicoccales archaeon]